MTNSDNTSAGKPEAAAEERQFSDEELRAQEEAEQAAPSATGVLAEMLTGEAQTGIAATLAHSEGETIVSEAETTSNKLNWPVITLAGIIVIATVIWGLSGGSSFANFSATALAAIMANLGWAYVLFGTVFVVFVIVVALSRFGTIKLGGQNEEPEFRTPSWIAMMFAAGMGIGLMFFGAAEPLSFYRDGVPGYGAENVEASMASAMFHWTLHPWAIYAIVGLAIAYSTFRVGRRQLISSAFTPLIGERLAKGWLGQLIDLLSIIATVFGTACSLGLGAVQIGAGLKAGGLIEDPSLWVLVGVVAVLTLAFLLSAVSGVGKGIQYISNFNMVIAAVLAVFVFVLGPTVAALDLIPGSIGAYLSQFFEMTARTGTTSDGEWLSGWTLFYWAWWVSWSPFVGMFVARISRGRTVREFCLGVLLVPTAISVVWFAIFGGSAIVMERNGNSIYGDGTTEYQLFNLLDNLPAGQIASFVAVILLATFFITSADSASTVMGSMSQYGRSDANPLVSAGWGLLTALIGLTMLISGGDDVLSNLQNVTIVAATPFLFIVFLLMFAIVRDLRHDVLYLDLREQQRFNRALARERRIHRELQERESRRAQRREIIRAPRGRSRGQG